MKIDVFRFLSMLCSFAGMFCPLSMRAQAVKFAVSGSEWKYLFRNQLLGIDFEANVKFSGDTVINGDSLKLLWTYFTNSNDNECN